jgi:2-methylisocitrate lyase-like PEP mutase family enzyme
MDLAQQKTRAVSFRGLHQGPQLLVLPNAWDVLSARLFEEAGFPAVATTSGGLASVLGFADGEKIPLEDLFFMVRHIAASIRVPLSVDFERGFSNDPKGVETNCRALIEAGGVGINLEDGTGDRTHPILDVAAHCEKIRAARAAGNASGVPLVINARTDLYLRQVGDAAGRADAVLARGAKYFEAGADSLFVPGVTDPETIGRLVRGLGGPMNVLALEGLPPLSVLQSLGVRRVTVGSGVLRAVGGFTRRVAEGLRAARSYDVFLEGALSSAELQGLFKAR